MTSTNFTTVFAVDQSPAEAFDAITNVRGWWSGQIDGDTDKLGAEFIYRYEDVHYSKQEITELVPNKKVVWRVLDAYLDFTEDPAEWNGTEITFEIGRRDDQTEVRFTHLGLVPEFECYDSCSTAWAFYINNSLRHLITTGQGSPNPTE
jgi:Activator of Hsp90 ATPase homolog 1-like protein